jgi:hypothetical protein
MFFLQLSYDKNAVRGLRIETRIRDRSPDPRVCPRTRTVERRGTAQQRTTDPASASGSAFHTLRYAAAFGFSLAHQKESCWVTRSESSTRIRTFRTDPSHPGIAFAGRAMPTMKGTVEEDDYRTEVRFTDKTLLKIKNFSLLRFTQHPDLQYCGSGTRIRT